MAVFAGDTFLSYPFPFGDPETYRARITGQKIAGRLSPPIFTKGVFCNFYC